PLALASALSGPYAVPRQLFYTVPREQPAITQPSSGDSPHLDDWPVSAVYATVDITKCNSGY
ncbi:MAG: hypothetical protein V3V96_10270, partial [Acidiferrobacterales bacterium]